MTKIYKKKILISAIVVFVIIVAGLIGTGSYMLNYSLDYPKAERMTAKHWKQRMVKECPWVKEWMDSVYQNRQVRDTFLVMPSGYRAHAIYLFAPKKTDKTAIIVHGYKVRAEGMLHIAFLYNHDFEYNVLLPDLYGHGLSEGDHIQMGWNDRFDVLRWAQAADEIFADGAHTRQVVHGISMGAATVMALSGEKTPHYIRCFVEDCGFSSVRDEFKAQLKAQFGLPEFPLMDVASAMCKLRYGWSFDEASQISQVKKSTRPMLFIHGEKDDFVPYVMLSKVYEAKSEGRKSVFVAENSVHATAYSDHRADYTNAVRDFLMENLGMPMRQEESYPCRLQDVI